MLETNKLYLFGGSSTTTTTTTTTNAPPSTTSNPRPLIINDHSHNHHTSSSIHHLPGLQPQRNSQQRNGYYSSSVPSYNRQSQAQEEQEQGYSYHGQPARLNSAFGRHHENYTYKATDTYGSRPPTPSSSTLYNTSSQPSLPQQQQQPVIIKREEQTTPSIIMPPISTIKTSPVVPPPATTTEKVSIDEERESSIGSKWYTSETKVPLKSTETETDSQDMKRLKRKKEMTSKMEKLNVDFLEKREEIYTDKLISINKELKEAHLDTHALFTEGLRKLEKNRKKMIYDGELLREYQNQVTDNQFQLEIYQAEEEYTAEQQEIREKLFAVLEEKRRKLKEDKDNCDLAYDVVMESQARLNKRHLRKRGLDAADQKGNKRKQLTGPALVFKLRDEDINSDILAMRCGLNQSITQQQQLKKVVPANKKK